MLGVKGMKRTLAGLIALVFLSSAAWTFLNESVVEDWLVGQLVIEENDTIEIIPLQTEERWFVVVVDFEASPASNGWGPTEAETLMEQAVVPYIEQMSGNVSTLDITLHPEVVRASKIVAQYGSDVNGKDTGSDGSFLPAQLAEEAVASVRNDVNWSEFDLNGDDRVDRFLILHTTKGQEENPAIENRIWSHFTQFDTPISLPNSMLIEHYTMASLQTGSSGVGTMIHEMLHQMGAVDLYPVHDEVGFQAWKGPGDWDIMASGNWNGGGRWPAMPTGANMELLRPERIETLDLQWPSTASAPCIGPSILMEGITEGGHVLKIPINDNESVFIEHRSDSGYDSRLPGHGILVSYQDLSVGDFERNEVNTNPHQPWLKVIEADNGYDLVSGANQGEESDLFRNGTSFGAHGVEIRSHDGILVPWTATVHGEENLSVSFSAEACTPPFELDLADHGATLLRNEHIPIDLSGTTSNCSSSLTSTDGRGVALVQDEQGARLQFSRNGTTNSFVQIEGTITCSGHTIDLDYSVFIMNRIPVESTFQGIVHPASSTVLDVPIHSVGADEQRLSVHLDGPLSRVASGPSSVVLSDDSTYLLTIEPNGLLTENMLVYGSIELMTDEGMVWTIDVALEATSTQDSWSSQWTQPGRVIGLMLTIVGLSALTSAWPRKPTTPDTAQANPMHTEAGAPVPAETDAWGRQIDQLDSSESLDVEEGM